MQLQSLTKMQKAYCEWYVNLQDKREAYRRAGYKASKPTTIDQEANRMHKNPKIIAYIKYLMDKMPKDRVADAQEVCAFLTRVMRGEEKDAFGLDVSMQDRLKAADGLAKRYQLYTNRVEADVKAAVTIVNDLADDDDAAPANNDGKANG